MKKNIRKTLAVILTVLTLAFMLQTGSFAVNREDRVEVEEDEVLLIDIDDAIEFASEVDSADSEIGNQTPVVRNTSSGKNVISLSDILEMIFQSIFGISRK